MNNISEDDVSLILEAVAPFLDVASIMRAIPTSSTWRLALTSEEVWADHCSLLWRDKVHVPERYRDYHEMSRMHAYFGSLKDGQRTEITADELCAYEWSTRMKSSAGEEWTGRDPWWQSKPAGTRAYRADGTFASTKGDGSWRFPRGLQQSAVIRHMRDGIEFPTHFVIRHPNWGWLVQNCWSISSSFPLPLRGQCSALEDEGIYCTAVTVENCHSEAMLYNAGLPLPALEQVLPRRVGDDHLSRARETDGRNLADNRGVAGSSTELSELESRGVSGELLASLAHTWALFDRFDRAGERLQLAAANAFAHLRDEQEDTTSGAVVTNADADA